MNNALVCIVPGALVILVVGLLAYATGFRHGLDDHWVERLLDESDRRGEQP